MKKLWKKLFTKNDELDEIALHISGATVRNRNSFENIEVPRNEEELSDDFIEKWVVPFYNTSLSNPENTTIKAFAKASKEINIEIVTELLSEFDWRPRITGAFFAAINNYAELEDIIGKHLLKSEVCFAAAGYCLALATFATENSKDYLKAYLGYYLDRKDLWYDQSEAYCALEYLDKNSAAEFSSKWQLFISDKPNWDLDRSRRHLNESILTLDKIRELTNLDIPT